MAQVKDPLTDSGHRSSREMRDSIRRTRARMDETVDAIEERLTPGELLQEAWGLLRGGSSSSLTRIWRIARQHPMPAAIISLGVGWMVYESGGGGTRRDAIDRRGVRYASDARWADARWSDARWSPEREEGGAFQSARETAAAATRRATDAAASAVDKAGELAADARDAAGASVRRATDAAGAAVEKAGDLADDVAESVRRQATEFGRQATELGAQARDTVRDVRTGFWETLEEQPLVVGAATLAAGLLVGLLLPSTPREDELMGKTRDSLLDQVREIGQQTIEKGKEVASAAAETLKQGAEAHGVSAEAVVETVRAVARDVVETVKTEAQAAVKPEGQAASDTSRQPGSTKPPQPPQHRAA